MKIIEIGSPNLYSASNEGTLPYGTVETLPESMGPTYRKGGHASIEVDEETETVKKKYDLTAAINAQQAVDSYLSFRRDVGQFYSLPELVSTDFDGKSFAITEQLIRGPRADIVISQGTQLNSLRFVAEALLPLSGQIIPHTVYDLGKGRISRTPLKNPVDIKPSNFVIGKDGKAVFVDVFPPLIRQENGSLESIYDYRDGNHTAWIYGDASIIITKFIMDSISANPAILVPLTITMLETIGVIDPSGLLLCEMKVNTSREKTRKGFNKISHGLDALNLIETYASHN